MSDKVLEILKAYIISGKVDYSQQALAEAIKMIQDTLKKVESGKAAGSAIVT